MLNNKQIRLVQVAIRKAGIREKDSDGRYRLLLGQYRQPNAKRVTSCKQLDRQQLDDILAICESMGWRCPGRAEDHYRKKSAASHDRVSYGQLHAIKQLAGDLGWNEYSIIKFIEKITDGAVSDMTLLTIKQAHNMIEAMKAIFGRSVGKKYNNLKEIQKDMEAVKDGKVKTSKDEQTTADLG